MKKMLYAVYHIMGNFWREKFLEILEKINDFRMFFVLVFRDGYLEAPDAH